MLLRRVGIPTTQSAHGAHRTREAVILRRHVFTTLSALTVFDYIERFYNPRRRHSTLGYVSPDEFERVEVSLG